MDPLDRPGPVRPGEDLPVEVLARYLQSHLPGVDGPLSVAQFPHGYSNRTYLLRMGGRELVLRRPPPGVAERSAHDMGREYRVLSGLAQVYDKVPRPLHYCADPEVIGAPFYVMERVQGLVLRAEAPSPVPLSPDLMARLSRSTVDNLARIHRLDYQAAGLGDLGRPTGYVARQIQGWTRRYRAVQTEELPGLEDALAWLAREMPPETDAALIHNDYKYDNLVLNPADPARILAVLDWEMCTVGDPLMDLGTTLAYWTEPGDPEPLVALFGLTALPGNLDRQQLVERYGEQSDRPIPAPFFYYIYGLVKVAVILQQLYHRYRQGLADEARYGRLNEAVRSCSQMLIWAFDKGRIHRLSAG
ncbi:phosphotransferase family protein [Litorilinea aerophila]|uniref:Phosphotransferase family protein n=1 Tax=Litorilinea aerophila TaxID=1204385 RepID=A0A540VEI3_9CHLR|nr:phosphotransferase family protein [Litorilinea aerophila]MCC9077066.1 phosphotransferase family protein [Litorilinea aerophila]OUC07321.1 aminoglycoside phosphotransferase [Litorilinea aerophila]